MTITIPDATLGAKFTNDITGVTYTYDGQKWIADSGSAGGSIGEHEHDEEYVNVSGDTMTGDLRIEPTTGSQPLVVKANPEASSNANVLDVFSNEGNRIFWVDSNRAGTTVHAGRPTNSYDLTDKKYVDDKFATSGLAASPINFSWKYTSPDNQSTNLKPGEFYGPEAALFDGSRYHQFYFHMTPYQASIEFQAYASETKFWFDHYQVLGSFWFNHNNIWKHKGHMWIKNIEWDYKGRGVLRVMAWSTRNAEDNIDAISKLAPNEKYGFTIGGFF